MYPSGQLMILVLSLALYVVASPLDLSKRASSVVIGYRVVDPTEAKIIQDAGSTFTVNPKQENTAQLGPGVYTSPGMNQWDYVDTPWNCVVLADSDAWSKVNKAWVPKTYVGGPNGCALLWNSVGVPNIPDYLTSLDSSFTKSNTVLLSEIYNLEPVQQQALIPPQLLGSSGGLDLKVQCYPATDLSGTAMISQFGDVDYTTWNAQGSMTAY